MSYRTTSGGWRRPNRPQRSLAEARRELQENLDNGTTCECCNRFAKRYRRHINSGQARTLIWMAKHSRTIPAGQYIDLQREAPNYVLRSREVGKLVHWGLVESPPEERSGKWRLTLKGYEFATNKIRVPKYAVLLYNKIFEGYEGDPVSIRDALGSKFDFDELMSA